MAFRYLHYKNDPSRFTVSNLRNNWIWSPIDQQHLVCSSFSLICPGEQNPAAWTKKPRPLPTKDFKKKLSTGLYKTIIKRILKSWRFCTIALLLVVFCNKIHCEATPFILWLDSQPDRDPVALVKNLSTVTNRAAVAGALMRRFYSGIRGSRSESIILSGVLCIFANLLKIWNMYLGNKGRRTGRDSRSGSDYT